MWKQMPPQLKNRIEREMRAKQFTRATEVLIKKHFKLM